MRFDTHLGCLKEQVFLYLTLLSFSVDAATVENSINAASRESELISRINEHERNGRMAEADSLFGALAACSPLNREQLYRWARCRELIRRYTGSVELYCRLLDADTRFAGAVYGRLHRLLEEAPRDSIGRALAVFERCALRRRGIDTLKVRLKLAQCYAGYGLDSAELGVVAAASGPPGKVAGRLLEMARRRYTGGRYAAAVRAASFAYERAGGGRVRTDAAELISRAYRAVRRYDSALAWITRSDLSSESRKIDAAALYQRAGMLAKAEAVIGVLSRSFSRDTLELRQRLYRGDKRGAREFARKSFAGRPQFADEALLWKVRTLLFDGAFGDLSALLDTAAPPSSRPGTAAILDCRLMLKSLRGEDAALAAWSRQEYDMFAGKADRAAARLSGREVPSGVRKVLFIRFVKELLVQGDSAAAARFFEERGEDVDSPEYRYLYAEHLLRTAGPGPARGLLLRIIREYPGNLFSEKSRVLLEKIK
jgi:tetratricopeptide (TPR) repeat protein